MNNGLTLYQAPQQFSFEAPLQNTQQKKKKSFLVDNISTGLGILGGIGGSFIAPIAGTAAGAGAMSAVGEAIENKIMGEDLTKNVVKEGLLGALMGPGPLRLGGKVISKVAPRAGQSIEQAGKNLLGSQANLTRAEARKIGVNPQDTLGEINKTTGLTNINKMAEVGSNVTGKDGVFSELTRNAIGNTKGVDIGDLRTLTNDLLVNKAPSVTGSVRKNVEEQVKNSVVKAYGGSKGSLNTLADPYEAFDIARTFEANASRLRSLPTPTSADKELASVYSSLAKEINTRLFNAPGVADGIIQARPQAAEALRGLAKTAKSRSEKQAYEQLAKQAEGFKDVQSVRSAQAPFVQLGKIDEATARAQAGAGAQLGGQMQGAGKLVQNPLNMLAAPLNAATPTVGGVLTRAGRSLQGKGTTPTKAGIAGRVGAAGLTSALLNQATSTPTVKAEAAQPPETAPTADASLTSALLGQDTPQQSDSPLDPANIQLGVQQILASGGSIGDATEYVSLIAALQKLGDPGKQEMGYGRPTAQQYAQGTAGLDSVDKLEQLLATNPDLATRDATPGQGLPVVGGLVSKAAGTNEYRAVTNNILNSIARINTGAAMPQSEEGFYRRTYLPQPGDDEATRQAKLDNIRRFFAPIVGYRGGGGDLADALAMGV